MGLKLRSERQQRHFDLDMIMTEYKAGSRISSTTYSMGYGNLDKGVSPCHSHVYCR